jgi:hypothetical protein
MTLLLRRRQAAVGSDEEEAQALRHAHQVTKNKGSGSSTAVGSRSLGRSCVRYDNRFVRGAGVWDRGRASLGFNQRPVLNNRHSKHFSGRTPEAGAGPHVVGPSSGP